MKLSRDERKLGTKVFLSHFTDSIFVWTND